MTAVMGLVSVPFAGAAEPVSPDSIFVYDLDGTSAGERAMMSSVAGIVGKSSANLYLAHQEGGGQSNPKFWLDQYVSDHPETAVTWQSNPTPLLNRYSDRLDGYVLYDNAGQHINEATSVAGIENAMIVTPELEHRAQNLGLQQVADVRGKDTQWVVDNYGNQFNSRKIFNQSPDFSYQLRDYAIQHKGLMFYKPPNKDQYLAAQEDHSRVYGWGASEGEFFSSASRNNLMAVPADHQRTTAAPSRWDVSVPDQKNHATANDQSESGKHYVSFVMSDGDNVQWLTNDFARDDRWFGSQDRGDFDMTWDMSPTLAEMNPVAMKYIYEQAASGSGADQFVTASGRGINYPSEVPDVEGMMQASLPAMEAVDHRAMTVLDKQYDRAALAEMIEDPQVLGLMLKTGAAYKGLAGQTNWIDGKPVLSPEYSLWEGFDTPQTVINGLNAASREALNDPDAYTVVNVHPWSGNPMDKVSEIVQGLDNNVEVINLEQMMVQMRRQFGEHRRAAASIGLQNGDFEDGDAQWLRRADTTSLYTQDGNTAAQFSVTGPEAEADWRTESFEVEPGDHLKFSFRYLTPEAAEGSVLAQLRSFDEAGNFEGEKNVALATTDGNWTQVLQRWTVPEGGDLVDLRLSNLFTEFSGLFRFDEVRLQKMTDRPAGDINGDWLVNATDRQMILDAWGADVKLGAALDPSLDGKVGQADLDWVMRHMARPLPKAIPEPNSLGLLAGLGGATLLPRRRR
jgi:hypothetical protein